MCVQNVANWVDLMNLYSMQLVLPFFAWPSLIHTYKINASHIIYNRATDKQLYTDISSYIRIQQKTQNTINTHKTIQLISIIIIITN